jgi:hypothetical protein
MTARVGVLLGLAAGLLVVVSVVSVRQAGIVQPGIAGVFLVVIALGELVRITLPGDRETAPVGMAASLAYALLGGLGTEMALHSAWQVVAVSAVGTGLGVLPHSVAGRAPGIEVLSRRMIVTAVAAFVYRSDPVTELLDGYGAWLTATVMIAVVLLVLLLDVALAAAVRSGRDHAPFRRALVEEFRALVGIGSAIAITGVLVALAAEVMGLWSLPVFGAPLLLVQFSFRRMAMIRSTYSQTIRSLSRVTELGGYTETGHLDRVADLAAAVGTELGMTDAELRDLQYAALLHDIGQLSLPEPIPAGATSWQAADVQGGIARDGAAVIAQTRVLDTVSQIVARQADPYRLPQQPDDPEVSLASRIIRVVNAYDDMVGDGTEPSRSAHALEQLRVGMVYDYDPRVVATLDRVLRRRAAH